MSILNWLSGNADTERKLREDISNLQDNLFEVSQLIMMLQQRVYKLEDAAKAAKATKAAKAAKATAKPKTARRNP